ncbi:MAG: hypothetical protein ACPL1F_00180 [bacterium]|jgi:hypothetical protein
MEIKKIIYTETERFGRPQEKEISLKEAEKIINEWIKESQESRAEFSIRLFDDFIEFSFDEKIKKYFLEILF